jgi:hypothetical protein
MMKQIGLTIFGVTGLLAVTALTVEAARPVIRVRCETRPNRSKISVDLNNVPSGTYTANVTSAGNNVSSTLQSVGDEVEFDFDSDSEDIADGAAAISGAFIVNRAITVQVIGPANLSKTAKCAAKRR